MNKIRNLILILFITVNSLINAQTYNKGIENTIDSINKLLAPKLKIDAINGYFITETYKNKELIKKSKIEFVDILDSNITYNTSSKYLKIKCVDYECVENNIYSNIKKHNYTKSLNLYIEDTTKAKNTVYLLKILTNQLNEPQITKIKQRDLDFTLSHHIISVMPLLLFWNGFGFSYEYVFNKDKIGIYIPFSFKFDDTYKELGISIKIYTGKNKAHNYSVASLYLGANKIRYFYGPEVINSFGLKEEYTSFRLHNGVSIQSAKHWNITAHLGLGGAYIYKVNEKSNYEKSDIIFDWGFYFNVGYRF